MTDFRVSTAWRVDWRRRKARRDAAELADALEVCIFNLWAYAAEHATGGILRLPEEEIPHIVECPSELVSSLVDILKNAQILAEKDGYLAIADWEQTNPFLLRSEERSKSAKIAALVRYHRMGRHLSPFFGCPLCDSKYETKVSHKNDKPLEQKGSARISKKGGSRYCPYPLPLPSPHPFPSPLPNGRAVPAQCGNRTPVSSNEEKEEMREKNQQNLPLYNDDDKAVAEAISAYWPNMGPEALRIAHRLRTGHPKADVMYEVKAAARWNFEQPPRRRKRSIGVFLEKWITRGERWKQERNNSKTGISSKFKNGEKEL